MRSRDRGNIQSPASSVRDGGNASSARAPAGRPHARRFHPCHGRHAHDRGSGRGGWSATLGDGSGCGPSHGAHRGPTTRTRAAAEKGAWPQGQQCPPAPPRVPPAGRARVGECAGGPAASRARGARLAPTRPPVRRRRQGSVRGARRLRLAPARLALEADGYRWHSGRQAWQRDLRRRNALTAAGWEVLHATWSDLGTDGLQILAEVGARLGVQFPGGSGSTIGYGTASPRAAGARAGPW